MDLSYSSEELSFRNEVRQWLAANLPEDLRQKVQSYRHLSKEDYLRWHKILAAKGWSVPHWPVEWGGTGWDITQRYIYDEEFALAGAPGLPPVWGWFRETACQTEYQGLLRLTEPHLPPQKWPAPRPPAPAAHQDRRWARAEWKRWQSLPPMQPQFQHGQRHRWQTFPVESHRPAGHCRTARQA